MSGLYFSPEDALLHLKHRKTDSVLEQKVREYLREEVPGILTSDYPAIVLVRNAFTPDCELDVFLEYSKMLNANPVLLEYAADKFVAKNKDKHALGKLSFYLNADNNGRPMHL
jgi:hypothetical protein